MKGNMMIEGMVETMGAFDTIKNFIGFGKKHIVSERIASEAKTQAKAAREIANKKIEDIHAQLNGCGDRWFLTPIETIDECKDEDKDS